MRRDYFAIGFFLFLFVLVGGLIFIYGRAVGVVSLETLNLLWAVLIFVFVLMGVILISWVMNSVRKKRERKLYK